MSLGMTDPLFLKTSNNHVLWLTIGWGVGVRYLTTSTSMCTINLKVHAFLTGQAEYSRSCERLESCLVTERSMMKSSMFFYVLEYGPMFTSHPPDVIYVMNKNRGGLGMRYK